MPYGMPREIASDKAPNFCSELQREMFAAYGITRKVSTPYRPQANGQIERMFRTIRPILATLCNRVRTHWDQYLALAAYSYNTAYHTAIKDTPFHLMFGRLPHPLPEFHLEEMEYTQNVDRLRHWKVAREVAYQGLKADQENLRDYYGNYRARPQPKYQVGDCVLACGPPPPDTDVRKVYPRFIGPYRIVEIRGPTLIVESLHYTTRVPQRLQMHIDRVRPCDRNHPNQHTVEELLHPFGETYMNLDVEADEEVDNE